MGKKKTTEEFIQDAKKIHGLKYDYSKVNYIDAKTKVIIICRKHGEFEQTPTGHLSGKGCKYCGGTYKLCKEEFIEKAIKVHGYKYDYSKIVYKGNHSKVCIVCPEHGEFWQEPANHLNGKGCRKCSRNSYNYSTDEWIELAKKIHGDKYDYSKVEYINSQVKVCIICPEHGEFWQAPSNHLNGQGCPHCNESKLEKYVYEILKENGIYAERQKKFLWLGRQSLDFYLPDFNIAIECQGIQHYKPIDFGGNGIEQAKKEFLYRTKRDNIKLKKTKEHNIKMIYVNEDNKINFLKELI